MKRNLLASFFSLVFMILVLDSGYCQQTVIPKLEEIAGNMPDWVKDSPPEDILWGIGIGGLSTTNASCEQAKFKAQAAIGSQVAMYVRGVGQVKNSRDVYQNEVYSLLCVEASNQAAFELSEFIRIDRRTKTADGRIWYRVYVKKTDAQKLETILLQYEQEYVNSYIERLEDNLPQ
jgi:hypothetical protein